MCNSSKSYSQTQTLVNIGQTKLQRLRQMMSSCPRYLPMYRCAFIINTKAQVELPNSPKQSIFRTSLRARKARSACVCLQRLHYITTSLRKKKARALLHRRCKTWQSGAQRALPNEGCTPYATSLPTLNQRAQHLNPRTWKSFRLCAFAHLRATNHMRIHKAEIKPGQK